MKKNDFIQNFKLLTDNEPFPWQKKLFDEFLSHRFRETCPVPTGLGKTSVIAVWLLALVEHASKASLFNFPRRLVYVVNRRTVVDQSTREAEALRDALVAKADLVDTAKILRSMSLRDDSAPLAISTLQGQFADNGEWRDDPVRPAIIVGTVDMIGSRLLFSGYGRGFKSRPLHAGFLGQDTLLVHDEAHLEPAFQELVTSIAKEQSKGGYGKFRVMELTATSRTATEVEAPLFTDADKVHPVARERIEARKGIVFHLVDEEKKIAAKIADLALQYKDSEQAILLFLRRVEDVEKVATQLRKKLPVETLTGTLRGWERDAMVRNNGVFARFMPSGGAEQRPGTVCLVCTSAGEVGVNISGDHLICDSTPFDSMMQRFGRVNRFGKGDAQIHIVHVEAESNSKTKKDKSPSPYEQACARTIHLLWKLPKRQDGTLGANPAALAELPLKERLAAFTPEPFILPASGILFDAWAMTSIRGKLPGRPPVADWLHGVAEWEPPETHVAWRDEVGVVSQGLLPQYSPVELLGNYPLKSHELLRDRTSRVFAHLEKIAARCPKLNAWVVGPEGEVEVVALGELTAKDKQKKPQRNLADCTVVLPPAVGGLKNGLLDGDTPFDESGDTLYDLTGHWLDEKGASQRYRKWDDQKPPPGMRLVLTIDTKTDIDHEYEGEAESPPRFWNWFVRWRAADDDGSRTARVAQQLQAHLQDAGMFADQLIAKLNLPEPEAKAVVMAVRWHDRGKDRRLWQISIGNSDYPATVLAKSGPGMRRREISRYRHELGSLLELAGSPEFLELPADTRDLVLHLVAAHHGRARPYFPAEEAFDPNFTESEVRGAVLEIPRRYARLQRKYGRWGLAYLESLVRVADIMASQAGDEASQYGNGAGKTVGGDR